MPVVTLFAFQRSRRQLYSFLHKLLFICISYQQIKSTPNFLPDIQNGYTDPQEDLSEKGVVPPRTLYSRLQVNRHPLLTVS